MGALIKMMITDQCHDGILLVTLDLGKGNLLSFSHIEKLYKLIENAEVDIGVKGLILTGTARCFSTGLDLSGELSSLEDHSWRPTFQVLDKLLLRLFSFSKPFVAAINGHSVGVGMLIQLCADWVIVEDSDRVKIGLPEMSMGLTIDSLMMHLARYGFHSNRDLQNILYTGELFAPSKAVALGVVNEVVEHDSLILSARERVDHLLKGGSEAFSCMKETMRKEAIDKMKASLRAQDYLIFDNLMMQMKSA